MQRLILMRHGDAERPSPGLEDFDRVLTAEGREESRSVGRALAGAGVVPDLALVSAARRTLETWRAVGESFASAAMRQDDSLYAASSVRLAAAAREAAADADTVILVGHNPGVHQLALHLAKRGGAAREAVGPLYDRFPTASAAVFTLDADATPRFERLFLAKTYRKAAP